MNLKTSHNQQIIEECAAEEINWDLWMAPVFNALLVPFNVLHFVSLRIPKETRCTL